MDSLNSYGVHPYWPVRNRWFCGDAVYIVEPLYWAATASLLGVVRAAAALMYFARAPFGVAAEAGWIMGDLRFVRGATPGFADIPLPAASQPATTCAPPAPWGVPREDLLRR